MNLGVFSISLAVKDIHASKAFYEKFGFAVSLKRFTKISLFLFKEIFVHYLDGNIEENWLVLKNEDTIIGII